MDLSKLPRMSKTPTPPPPESPATPVGANPPSVAGVAGSCPYCAAALRAGAKFCDNCGSPARTASDPGAGMMAEAWISVGIGILLLIMCPTMTKYVSHRVFHTRFAPYVDKDGNPHSSDSAIMMLGDQVTQVIPYTKTTPANDPNFWNDLAITSFALALIIEGVALVLSRRPIVVACALVVTVASTALNLVYLVGTFQKYGLALVSGLAVLFGIYMAIYQFRLLQTVRRN